ncbi:MAG: methyl-accepting chemotaxis protein [Burkholderiaceae bacterium]
MSVLKKISGFRGQVVTIMVGVCAVPMLLAGGLLTYDAGQALKTEAMRGVAGVASNKRLQIQAYFNWIADQNGSMAADPSTLDALGGFAGSIESLAGSVQGIAPANEIRAALGGFYRDEFGGRYERETGRPLATEDIFPDDPVTAAAQYLFIVRNPNPLGKKDALDNPADVFAQYNMVHANYQKHFREFIKRFGYYDLFLVDAKTERVVYSVFKELDFATDLKHGPYSSSGLAEVSRKAIETGKTSFVDYASYMPSYDAPASFVASPIRKGKEIVGTLVFQMPVDRINAVLQEYGGLGETGDSVLTGADGLLRSQARHAKGNTILVERLDPQLAAPAIDGRSGTTIHTNPDGEQELFSYQPVRAGDINWALLTHIDVDEVMASERAIEKHGLMFVAAAIFAAALVAIWWAGRLTRRLGGAPDEIVRVTERIAGGHLRHVPQTDREHMTGAMLAMAEMENRLHDVLSNAKRTAIQVDAGTAEIAAGNQGLSVRTEEQASALQETAAATEQITATVRQNAEHSTQANQLAQSASAQAAHGGDVVAEAVRAMAGIDASSERIVNIIGVIDEIAFQTNLLALNASVEAARAGEQGRGFAVVANEVRTLAGRSAKAAQEIRDLIQESVVQVREGTSLVRRSGEALDAIVREVSLTGQLVNDICQASQEQSSGIDQINAALGDMDANTQQNAALVEEAAATAHAMHELAGRLGEMLSFFKLDEREDELRKAFDERV